MNKADTGGPASPVGVEAFGEDKTGMTLRDYFAAKAMQGFVMDQALEQEVNTAPEWFEGIANASYAMADAMLKARGQ
jgi:hypothetical protein